MDPLMRRLPASLLGHMSRSNLSQLIQLLEMARRPCLGLPHGRE